MAVLGTAACAWLDAATFTWDGGGTDNNWTTSANWAGDVGPGKSSGSHTFKFAGGTRLGASANSGTWTVGGIEFSSNAGAFNLNGDDLTLGGGGVINYSAAIQTIGNQIKLGANQQWNAANGAIVSTGYFDAANRNLTLTGSSAITISGQLNNVATLALSGSGNRTFGGQVKATTVNVNNTGTNIFNGQLNVTTLNVFSGTNHFANVQAGNGGINVGGTAHANFTGPVSGGNGGITISSSGDIDFSGTINSGTLTLNGTGTTRLSGSGGKSTGAVVVNNGTLVLAQTGGGDAFNNSLTVNAGGTVVFEGDNQVPHWQTVTLNQGSTLFLGDTSQSFAKLVITGDSVIDFGTGGSELDITYGGIEIADNLTLTIVNWDADAGDIFAGSNPGQPVVNVQYADSNGNIYATGTWGGGLITPGSLVPEPSTYGLMMLGAGIGFVLWRRRKNARRFGPGVAG